ncbi:hypothetical protein [Ruegeria sp.]|uniref:hypothetical protein n=1 Tax=Ruegeria sp. TaxID=1879320 RepID=UPI003C7DFA64
MTTIPDLSLSAPSAADATAIAEAAAQSADDVVNDILKDLENTGSADTRADVSTGDVTGQTGPVVFGAAAEDGFFSAAVRSAGLKNPGGGGGANPLIVLGVLGAAGLGLWWLMRKRG